MHIAGWQKVSLVDYPGKVACTLFTGGCNLRCPYCHNSELLEGEMPSQDMEEVMAYLDVRKGILDGVVISGGEPCLQSDLVPFLARLKEKGLLVKLDTNGYRPDVFRQAVEKRVVDYVAMDIKTSLDEYPKLCGVENIDTSRIKESIDYLMTGVVDYEFRTTVVEPLHHEENFKKIGQITKGCRRYFLQSFVESGNILGKNCFPPSSGQLQNYLEILSSYIENVSIRDRG